LSGGDSVVTKLQDTIIRTFTAETFPYPGWTGYMPDAFHPYSQLISGKPVADQHYMQDSSDFHGCELKGAVAQKYTVPTSGCWNLSTDILSYEVAYANGLGEVVNRLYSLVPSPPHRYETKLIGYVKSNGSWGDTLFVSCTWPSSIAKESKPGMVVKVIPSPVKITANVIVETVGAFHVSEFSICDLTGKEVLHLLLSSPVTSFDRKTIAPGLYIWKVTMENTVLTGKVVFE
jgi:hypothetical protein